MPSPVALVADVGGSQIRLALAEAGQYRPTLRELRTLPTPSGRLRQTLSDYVDAVHAQGISACAVASVGRVQRLPGRCFSSVAGARLIVDRDDFAGNGSRLLLNELAAVASSLPLLSPDELHPIGPPRVGAPGAQIVVRVGQGLGVAVHTADGNLLETEAGHLDLAAVSAEERQWVNRLAPLGRLSVDGLLSEPGLVRLYEAVGGAPNATTSAVVSRARSGEPTARKAVIAFSTWLGRCIGNLILSYGAWNGVYLLGPVLDGLADAFDAGAFRTGMEDKAPMSSEIAAVPVYQVLQRQAALLGLARLALVA